MTKSDEERAAWREADRRRERPWERNERLKAERSAAAGAVELTCNQHETTGCTLCFGGQGDPLRAVGGRPANESGSAGTAVSLTQ